jgi:hypothetical protein
VILRRTISIGLSGRSSRSRCEVTSPARTNQLSGSSGKPRASMIALVQPSGFSARRARARRHSSSRGLSSFRRGMNNRRRR